jgi:hypothetical protein
MCAGTIESDVTYAECTSSVNIREQFFLASTLYLRPKKTIEQDSSKQASDLLKSTGMNERPGQM